ncbi:hypothetical protein FFWV33_02085 [Flavobacterium faecale]|uniref:Uncharacterized protein n=1 Tax=Flavobacterium faecale TaxID=1355330 RepID=A0A2S1L9I2_9FLAO|nr:hypothetical protein [Flavobacterium faecale]AWG20401.1 hypothetical protein FFWV33_02085 [Flavobacterium faecale]
MKIYNYLAIIVVTLSVSCKDNTAPVEKNTVVKSNTPEVKVDTSYKKNIRLYDQFYYGMASDVAQKLNNQDSTPTVKLNYKNQSFELKKDLKFNTNLLQSIKLSGDSYDGTSILNLFKEKYGEPTVVLKKIKSEENEIIATKILQYLDNTYTKIKYVPRIHKEVSNEEFQKHFEQPEIMSGKEASRKLHVVRYGSDHFSKVMKDITKNETIELDVEVAIENNSFSKSKNYVTYTWNEGKKEVQLHFLKSVTFSGNKTYQRITLDGGLSINFSNMDDKINTLEDKKPVNSIKQLEKKSFKAI